MELEDHYRKLENMYQAAPVNEIYKPRMTVSQGRAEIEILLDEKYHHAAGAVHGSVYFKMLDDAAFFAANSLEFENFVLTASFTTYLTRPVVDGAFRSAGVVVHESRSQMIAESVVYNAKGKECGRGNGIFTRGRLPLAEAKGFEL